MKIQILAEDGKLLDTIHDVHINLKSQFGMGKLLDQLIQVYKNKYMVYMYEKYKMERRSGDERRHPDDTSTSIKHP
jgi:negative regulator of sigma E activity